MIRIILERGELDLDLGLKMPFELNNSAFLTEYILGSKSYTASAPGTSRNHYILENSAYVPTRPKGRIYPCEVYLGGGQPIVGSFYVDNFENGNFNFAFIVNGFSTAILEKKLSEVMTDPDVIMAHNIWDLLAHAKNQSLQSWPQVNYVFPPIKWPKFYQDDPADTSGVQPDFAGICNAYDAAAGKYLSNSGDPVPPGDPYNNFNLVPQLFAKYVLKKIFQTIGYNYGGEWIQDKGTDNLLVANNYALDRLRKDYLRVSISAPVIGFTFNNGTIFTTVPMDDETTAPNGDPDEEYDNISLFRWKPEFNCGVMFNVFLNFDNHTPSTEQIRAYIVDETDAVCLQSTFNPSGTTGVLDIPSLSWNAIGGKEYRLVIAADSAFGGSTTTNTMDITSCFMEVIMAAPKQVNRFERTLKYSNHVPDFTIKDFLNGLRKHENLRIDFDFQTRTVLFNYAESPLKRQDYIDITSKSASQYRLEIKPPKKFVFQFDWADDKLPDNNNFYPPVNYNYLGEVDCVASLPTPIALNDYILVQNVNQWFIVKDDPLTPGTLIWTDWLDRLPDVTIGQSAEEEETISMGFSPFAMRNTLMGGDKCIIPYIDQLGSSPAFESGINSMGLKFLFYHGFKPNRSGDLYPLASSTNRDYAGNIIDGKGLMLSYSNIGIIERRWSQWLSFLTNAEEYRRFLKFDEIDFINLSFEVIYRIDNQHFLLKQIRTNATHNGLEFSETTMVRI